MNVDHVRRALQATRETPRRVTRGQVDVARTLMHGGRAVAEAGGRRFTRSKPAPRP
jgi:hypothetical protein